MNKSVVALVVCFLINSIVDLFVHTFFTAHMLYLSGNSIAFISQFYILTYFALGLGFVLLLPLMKKLNRAVVLRVGIVLKAVFLLLVVLLGKNIIAHVVWLAILYGFVEALFWSGGNTLKNQVVASNKIKGLISVVNINAKIVGIVCPIVLGLSIDAWSFTKIAIAILVLMAIQITFSVFIKQPIGKDEGKASLKEFFKAIKNNEQKKFVMQSFWGCFLRGLQYFLPIFLTYLIICLYGTNTSLGILTTIASAVAVVLLILFNAIKKADSAVWLYALFALIESVALILAVVFMNKLFIVIFQIVSVSVTIVVESMIEGLRGSTIRDAGLNRFMPEAMVVSEIFLNSGRVLGFLALMLVGIFNSFVATIILSCIFVVWLFVYFIFVGILKNNVKKYEEQKQNELKKTEKTKNMQKAS